LKKLFPCYHCKRVLRSKDAVHGHECVPSLDVKRNKKSIVVKCPQCEKQFSNQDEMICHKFTFCEPILVEDEPKVPKLLDCRQCDEQFVTKDEVVQHQNTVCKKSYACADPHCEKRFKERAYRNRHFTRQHTNKITVEKGICDICGAVLAHKSYLDRHKKEQHDPNYTREKQIKSFTCTEPGCGKVLHSKQAVEMHNSAFHAKRRQYFECYLCPKKFCTLISIRTHVCEHLSDPEAALVKACDFCNKKFVDEKRLNLHRRTHTMPNVPVKCDQCPKIFQRIDFMIRHRKSIHEGIYYECCYCQHHFMGEVALKCHMFEHRGFRPFNCMKCPAEFVRRTV
jgi:KRAB domain-containing zinc finger protein